MSDVYVNAAAKLVENRTAILIRHALNLAPRVVGHVGPWVRRTGLSPGQSSRNRGARNGWSGFGMANAGFAARLSELLNWPV